MAEARSSYLDEESDKVVERIRRLPQGYNDLPGKVIRIIFSYLPFFDLHRSKTVCPEWEIETKNVNVWKYSPLYINEENSSDVCNYICQCPYLHTVMSKTYCSNRNQIISFLTMYVLDLKKMNVMFYNLITDIQLLSLTTKFINLESVSIGVRETSIINLLNILEEHCKHLKEIIFYTLDLYCVDPATVSGIFSFLKTHFPSLNSIDIDNITMLSISYFDSFSNDVCTLLSRRLADLSKLVISYYYDIPYTLYTVLSCSTLRNLELRITCIPFKLNMEPMLGLNTLKLSIKHDQYDQYFPPEYLSEATYPPNLRVLYFDVIGDSIFCNLFKRVITTASNLNVIKVSGICDANINEQMSHLSRLQDLQVLSVTGCSNFSARGIYCISKCKNISCLEIADFTLSDCMLGILKKCEKLQFLDLENCQINTDSLERLAQLMCNLGCVSIIRCKMTAPICSINNTWMQRKMKNYQDLKDN